MKAHPLQASLIALPRLAAAMLLAVLSACKPESQSAAAATYVAIPEAACEAASAGATIGPDARWYPTVAPSEAGNDAARTHVFAGACSAVDAAHEPALMASATGLPGLYNAVTRGRDEVYALGGAYGHIEQGQGPYVVGLDSTTLRQRWRTSLPGQRETDWNYPGALGVAANGKLYATYGRYLARLDPVTGAIEARLELPANQSAADVAYNGFMALSDGMLVAKSIHREPGCTRPDFQAFLSCDAEHVAASTIVLIDPATMRIAQSVVAPEHIRFRVSLGQLDGVDYVYLPGDHRIHRYRYEHGTLTLDDWVADYLAPGQRAGTAVVALGEWIIIQTNGLPAAAPLAVVAISQRDPRRQFRIEPFAAQTHSGSFMPSLPSVDVQNSRVYTFDGYVGQLAALDFDPQRGFSTAWHRSQRSFAFSALVGSAQRRVLIGTDMRSVLSSLMLDHLGLRAKIALMRHAVPQREQLVWLDAASGRELGHTAALAAVGGSVPIPGYDGSLLVPDLDGGALLRFAARGATARSDTARLEVP